MSSDDRATPRPCTRCRELPRQGTSSWCGRCKSAHRAKRRQEARERSEAFVRGKPLPPVAIELRRALWEHYTVGNQR